MRLFILSFASVLLFGFAATEPGASGKLWKIERSLVQFSSDAPLEVIKAETTEMAGLINSEDGTFAFSIPISSFAGFNSPLQMEHFHENYMETKRFRNATFKGRIIEDIDFTKPGTFDVRTKGTLTIHGIEQVRIIPATMEIASDRMEIRAEFIVPLSDHNISIPKIVEQKIAREISVKLGATFTPNETP